MICLKKELKRSRLFEIQKITKRLRALEKRRGTASQLEKNQRKVQRLQEDLVLVKNVSISELCSKIETKGDVIQLAQLKEPPNDLSDKAEWRLLTSKAVSGSLKELIKDEPANRPSKKRRFDRRRGDERRGGIKRPGLDERPEGKERPGGDERPEGNDRPGGKERPGGDERLCGDDCEVDLRTKECTDATAVCSSERSGDRLDSVFVTSLSSRAVGHGEGKLPHKKRQHVIKKNRLGQRSRRKLWEDKYGRKAKHLSKISSKRKRHVDKVSEKPKKIQGKVKPKKKEALEVKDKEKDSGEMIHPSWAAKKQLKTGIKQFQGHKIVFDSD